MFRRIIILICTMLLTASHANAQLFRYLETDDGLSSRRVIAISKDTQGYIWFLTNEGVDRYNGKQYFHYQLEVDDKKILQFPNMSIMHVDKEGNIWISMKNGYLWKYNAAIDKFELKQDLTKSDNTSSILPLTHTRFDDDDNLWICGKNTLYIYKPSTEELYPIDNPITEEITYIRKGKGNTYYIGTTNRILIGRLDNLTLKVETEPLLENFHIVQHLYYHHPTDALLIGTLMDGFYVFDTRQKTLQEIGNLKDVTMNRVITDRHNTDELLIATDGNGVYKLNMKTWQLNVFLSANRHYSNKMNGNIIKDIYQDEKGRIWMAVFPICITVYSEHFPEYQWMDNMQETDKNMLTSNQITYLMEDSDGDIWMTTSNGVSMFDIKKRTWISMLSSNDKNRDNKNHVFISLCEPIPGTILVGGYMAGMYRINKKDMTPQYFSPQSWGSNIRPDKYIRSIYRDEEGYVWAGGYYNFKRIDTKTWNMENHHTEYPITYITHKNKNQLWVGTINGLFIFDKIQNKMIPFANYHVTGTINTIWQEGEETTYVGTHGSGFWVIDNKTGEITNYNEENSAILSNNISCILPSNTPDKLIISTENELTCFHTQRKTFANWTKEQGMMVDKFNTAAGIRTSQGIIVMGSDKGIITIKAPIELPDRFQSKMVLSNFNVQDKRYTNQINDIEKLTLPYDQNTFSLNVSSINYDCPSRILYSWKMEGLYDEWTKPSPTNQIQYIGLASGEYTLRIRAILQDNWQTIEERTLQINITPPFSQSIWAFIIYSVLFVLIVSAIFKTFWARRESEVSKEKIQFFINTAHDIRTPLTLIKAPLTEIEETEKLTPQGQKSLATAIKSTGRLSELANKLIDFEKEELYTSSVRVSEYELNQYLQELIDQFSLYAEKKNIKIEFEGTEAPLHAWIDRNKIDSVVHNLISNALKYTPQGGTVSIQLKRGAFQWQLKISDTGIGIPEDDRKKLFKQLFRSRNAINQQITGAGIGMLQTYNLVKRHKGKINVTSKENEGTTFHLYFPIQHMSYKHVEKTNANISDENKPEVQYPETIQTELSEASSPHTLLIVEDNPDLRAFLAQSLSNNYHILEATNGREALKLLQKSQPDLIISDIMMPEMRGDEMCRIVKNNIETSHIPVILLTALGDRESIIQGLESMADKYIIKPFEMDFLRINIANTITNKELQRKRFSELDYSTEDITTPMPGLVLDQEFIIKATEVIKNNLDNDFNVDNLCEELHMSRSSLYNKIKALTGHSPSEFVKEIRLNEATLLLKSRKYTVAEVSDMLGYGDPKYFTDIFKKRYGVTPSNYIKKENP